MPNTFNFADWVTMEGLRMLLNDLTVAEYFNTDYNPEFRKDFAVGETVRVPLPQRFDVTVGAAFQPQPLDRPYTTVTVDQLFGVHFETGSVERALKLERGKEMFKREYLDKAMATIAQQIDSKAAEWAYYNTPNIAGVLGTSPVTTAIAGTARQRLIEQACPPGEKVICLPPAAMTTIVNGEAAVFNPQSEIAKAYKEGYVGRARNFDWYESMSLYRHTAGTWGGTVEVTGAGQSGSSILITATAGDTFNKGDVINIALVYAVNPMTRRSTGTLKQFVVTAALTAAGGGADALQISPAIVGPGSHYQNVDALPGLGADLTLWPGTTSPNGKSGIQGLALHRDAFALVGVPLDIPKAAEDSGRARDPKTGISVAYLEMFDPILRRRVNRFDVLMGFGNLHFDNAAVRLACA